MDVSKMPKATCNAHGSIAPGKWNRIITTRRISTALEVWVISYNCLRAPIKFASKHIPNTIWALPIFHPATIHPPQIPIPIIQYQLFICITNQWSKRVGGRRVGNLTLKRKRSESAPLGTSSNRSHVMLQQLRIMWTLYKPSIYQSDNLVKMAGPSPAFEHIDDWEPHLQEPAPPPNSSHNLKIRWVCILGPSSFSAFSMVSILYLLSQIWNVKCTTKTAGRNSVFWKQCANWVTRRERCLLHIPECCGCAFQQYIASIRLLCHMPSSGCIDPLAYTLQHGYASRILSLGFRIGLHALSVLSSFSHTMKLK